MNNIQMAFLGTEGTGKTVLITTLVMRYAYGSIYLQPESARTVGYAQQKWAQLMNQQWPASTPPDEMFQLQWTLHESDPEQTLAKIRFADCAGQSLREIFSDDCDEDQLKEQTQELYNYLKTSQILVFLMDLQGVVGTVTEEIAENLSIFVQMLWTLQKDTPVQPHIALVFTQFDRYQSYINQRFDGDILNYLKKFVPNLYAEYMRNHNFEIFPISAVADTQVIEVDSRQCEVPAPEFGSKGIEKLMDWLCENCRKAKEEERIHQKLVEKAREEEEEKARATAEKERVRKEREQKLAEKKRLKKAIGDGTLGFGVVCGVTGFIWATVLCDVAKIESPFLIILFTFLAGIVGWYIAHKVLQAGRSS